MSWGTRRRNSIIFIFFTVVFIVLSVYLFKVFYKPPDCFDGKRNGGEAGIDCGGSCILLCQNQTLDPIVRWSRHFRVSDGLYNVVAYVENPNPNGGVASVSYEFNLYDEENTAIRARRGVVELPPKAIVPIIGNSMDTGKLEATRVSFQFTEPFIFTRQAPVEPAIFVEDERISNLDSEPRIRAEITNSVVVPIKDVLVAAIVYDKNDNAIAVSSTRFPVIPAVGSVEAFYTWPTPFKEKVARFELIPVYEEPER